MYLTRWHQRFSLETCSRGWAFSGSRESFLQRNHWSGFFSHKSSTPPGTLGTLPRQLSRTLAEGSPEKLTPYPAQRNSVGGTRRGSRTAGYGWCWCLTLLQAHNDFYFSDNPKRATNAVYYQPKLKWIETFELIGLSSCYLLCICISMHFQDLQPGRLLVSAHLLCY